MSIFKKSSSDGIGIPWLWQLPNNHPFYDAAIEHDKAYDDKRAGIIADKTSSLVDTKFLLDCLEVAGDSWKLKAQAYLFYYLCRAWGAIYW